MDGLFSKQMPHSAEAEQAVLGSILIDSRCTAEVVALLKPTDFYIDLNRSIYEVICSMFNFSKPIDAVTLLDEMRLQGLYRDSSQAYLVELMNVTPTSANVKQYASIVKDKALLRGIAEAASDMSSMVTLGTGTSDSVLENAEKRIYSLRQGKNVGGLEPLSSILVSVYAHLKELAAYKDGIPGLPTGFGDLDKYIMGLNKSDLIILASRPGMGKTSIALNMALSACRQSDKAIAIFSLEMSKLQLALRILSSETHVDNYALQTGRIKDSEWKLIGAATSELGRMNIFIDDNSGLSVSDINAQCRRVKNLGLVVIDYLQLMTRASDESYENRLQAVSEMSRMMKIMAKELNVPVICLSQLSRASALRTDKRPVLSDLRESGSIEQDADIVLGLYREDYFNRESEDHNSAELIVMKNRHGSTGTIKLQWWPQYTTYTAVDNYHEE